MSPSSCSAVIGFLADLSFAFQPLCAPRRQACRTVPDWPSGPLANTVTIGDVAAFVTSKNAGPLQAGARHRVLRRLPTTSVSRRAGRPLLRRRRRHLRHPVSPTCSTSSILRRPSPSRSRCGGASPPVRRWRQRRLRGAATRSPHATSDRLVRPRPTASPSSRRRACWATAYPRALDARPSAQPDALAVDAGSIDPGPHYLGAGVPFTEPSRRAARPRHDPRCRARASHPRPDRLRRRCRRAAHLDWLIDIYREICRERGYRFRTAGDQRRDRQAWLKDKVTRGHERRSMCPRPHRRDWTPPRASSARWATSPSRRRWTSARRSSSRGARATRR